MTIIYIMAPTLVAIVALGVIGDWYFYGDEGKGQNQ